MAAADGFPSTAIPTALDADGPRSLVETTLTRGLHSTSLALGLSAIGVWILPPLQYASIPVLLYMGMPAAQAAYADLRTRQQVRAAFAETAILALCLAQRAYLAGALGFWLYFGGRMVLRRWHQPDSSAAVGPMPPCVRVFRAGTTIEMPIQALQAGDTVVVCSGEIIPVDGVITAGTAWVDAHPTGETGCRQVMKIHQHVCANHLVLAGSILVQIEPDESFSEGL